jgi:LmbE family N-acetylglucosaminyl deacetylase
MGNFEELLGQYEGKKLLAIFAHPDDESFVAAGLLQIAKLRGLKTTLLCLTRGGKGKNALGTGEIVEIRAKELGSAAKILSVDKVILRDYPDAGLLETKPDWTKDVKKVVVKENPDIIVTFDFSGLTGHPDHIVSAVEVFEIVKELKTKPLLFWRAPSEKERSYFKAKEAFSYAMNPNYILKLGISETLKKIGAVFAHRSQMQSFKFKLKFLWLFLSSRQETYFLVDMRRSYPYRFVSFKIDDNFTFYPGSNN